MTERYEDEMMDDLFFDEADGFDEGGLGFDEDVYEDAFDESDDDMWEGADGDYYDDEFDGFDAYDEFDEFDEEDAFEDEADEMEDDLVDAMADALGAEDADEFLGKVFGAFKRIGKKVLRGARRILPHVARMLPGPYGSMLSTGMRLLGRLRFEGGSEEEALDAFSELAAYDEAAVPVVSALALRALDKKKIKRLPKSKRKLLVKKITHATRQLMRKSRNPRVVRAIPIVVGKVRARTARSPMPMTAKAHAAHKIIKKVARSKRLAHKLAQTTPRVVRAQKVVRKAIKKSRRLPA